ncbi:MAG: ribonuclease H-like domain-containing protein [Methanomicrobiaceae archaeon]|nr:ribonuclease H-like domain-containing protein [Methanomicrobiaceae archaeon]MDD5419596.1 ribonuclease H-like domain-containing protein [Methanomicrobiaceae archaeon]
MPGPFDGIGRQWRDRLDQVREYGIVRDGSVFRTGLCTSFVFRSEFERARALERELVEAYRGVSLEDALCGSELDTGEGTCYLIESHDALEMRGQDREAVKTAILADLTLIYGIGQQTQERLKRRGYRTIADLTRHPRYRKEAERLLAQIESGDTAGLMRWIGRWHPASHPLVFLTCRFHAVEDFVFLDIETLGLFSRPIILFGVARISGRRIGVQQYLIRDIPEEQAALAATLAHLEGVDAALVTFNGRAFDLPYVRERLAYYGMPSRLALPHFDVLHFSRRVWKERFSDCRLVTLERGLFGIERSGDVPSQMVPEFYEAYLRSGNPGPLVPVVEHNRQDVITLARLFARLMEEWHACP